jgi:hypothetical protein
MANIIDGIREHPKPGDTAAWWSKQPHSLWSKELDPEEQAYMLLFTSDKVPPEFHIGRGIADPNRLSSEDKEKARQMFGDSPTALREWTNRENRRRIVAHYIFTHPATIQYQLELYRLSRDVNPVHYLVERFHQLIAGKEAFTGNRTSRMGAVVDIVVPIVIGRVLGMARAQAIPLKPTRLVRSLTDPIYDLPPEGGGMMINGRWYTEHALERMAPDTPQIRAELRTRAARRLEALGISPGSAAYEQCLNKALSKIEPRGIPPSVVEAEISKPGSTNVKVVTSPLGDRVITVIPRNQ